MQIKSPMKSFQILKGQVTLQAEELEVGRGEPAGLSENPASRLLVLGPGANPQGFAHLGLWSREGTPARRHWECRRAGKPAPVRATVSAGARRTPGVQGDAFCTPKTSVTRREDGNTNLGSVRPSTCRDAPTFSESPHPPHTEEASPSLQAGLWPPSPSGPHLPSGCGRTQLRTGVRAARTGSCRGPRRGAAGGQHPAGAPLGRAYQLRP